MNQALAILVVFSASLTACAGGFGGSSLPPCIERNGSCFDAMINGQQAVALASPEVLKQFEDQLDAAGRADLSDTKWQLAAPISGSIEVQVAVNKLGTDWFGTRGEVETLVRPLGDYEIKTLPTLKATPSVTVGGMPLATASNVIDENKLPPGDYIFIVTLWGSVNWDRKHIFAQVR